MLYVYLIRSVVLPDQSYVGITKNLKQKLKVHNSGSSYHTAKHKPWKLITYMGFADKSKAIRFEKYLKSGSGRAFANKRLW